MIFEQLNIGGGEKNLAYLIGDETNGVAAAVDPSGKPEVFEMSAQRHGLKITHILVTHSHHDHIAGTDELKAHTRAVVAGHPLNPVVDYPLSDGDVLSIGKVQMKTIHCPGHATDAVIYLVNKEKLIVGDEIFVGGVGITRGEDQARLHYHNLHNIIMKLDDNVEIYPGHDYGTKPVSTISEQRETNPYMQQPDFDSFWNLRRNWKTYVKEHGVKWG